MNKRFDAMGLTALGSGCNTLPIYRTVTIRFYSLSAWPWAPSAARPFKSTNALTGWSRFGAARVGRGIATGLLLYCIGALSIVGPVMAAIKGDQTMLLTNASLDFVTSIVFGASFGWGNARLCAGPLYGKAGFS